jgi:CrcB protein
MSDLFRVGMPSRRNRGSRALASIRRDGDVVVAIALGGGLGSLARYAVAVWVPVRPGRFPWSTFLVNAPGCLLIGVLIVFVSDVWRTRRYARPFLGVGVLGGFTTYSTMMLDLRTLGAGAHWVMADVYLVASLVAGLAAVWVGVMGTRLVTGIPVWRRHKLREDT